MDGKLEAGLIVLCTVEKIVGTTVFVIIEDNGEGTITTSEIAPGRIRNLRDYVIPGKKIVCKILSVHGDKIHLSLRRVKEYEKKELLNKISKEKSYKAIIKAVVGDHEKIIEKITKEYSVTDFFEIIKDNPEIIEKYFNKKDSEKITQILETKKEKPKEITQIFNLSNYSSCGIVIVKEIIQSVCKEKKCNVSYIAAGKYRISLIGNDFKEIKLEMNEIISNIEKLAKKQNCEFSV